MNKVSIIFKDGKVFAVRSTPTLAEITINISKQSYPKSKFNFEEWEVQR